MEIINRHTPEGALLLKHFKERRDSLHTKLATELQSEREADTIRGRLAEIKAIEKAILSQVGTND